MVLALALSAHAAEISVADVAGLTAAIGAAAPGDVIILEDGDYALAGVSCTAHGTEGSPITVRSATPLGAHVAFDGVEGFKVSGAHWHFEGLDIRGTCADDSTCEHAFHVTGAAAGFALRDSRVVDFNAQLKVNAAPVNDVWTIPHRGTIERNEIFDTRARQTGNPTTKLNIDTGDDWVVRDNYLHDFEKGGGDGVSYGAFMKSGGHRGVFERNLIVCSTGGSTTGTRVGMSFGGGGTGAQYCAPAFDPNVPCEVEHTDGVMRNNIVASCSDVAVYLNKAANTQVLFNTFIKTWGVDYRFGASSGHAHGNLMDGRIRDRDGATHTEGQNQTQIDAALWSTWYADALHGDLSLVGDVSALIGAAEAGSGVSDDYCARDRVGTSYTVGALEHSLGDCGTVPPPGPAEDDPDLAPDDTDSGDDTDGDEDTDGTDDGCACDHRGGTWAWAGLVALLAARRRGRR